MKVLVTGGAGYIGSVCTEELLNAGHAITVFDNLSEGHRAAVDPRAEFILGDLADRAAIMGALRRTQCEAVMHFAANALVGESMVNPSKYFRNNSASVINLLDAAVEVGLQKFVFSSTCATYGIPKDDPITEATPQVPVNPYGESKRFVERMLDWYQQIHRLSFVALRYFNAGGASERFGEHHRIETHLIPNILMVALGQKQTCDILGTDYPTPDGTCIRDFVHVRDIAQAHIKALSDKPLGFFNLGTGNGVSVREVIQACERVVGKPIATVDKPRRPGDPARLVAGAEKARTELGWTPLYSNIEVIVQTAWDWHRRHPQGYAD